jgi:hypothetical protein
LTWNDDNRFLDYETRLPLSLTNAVGAGRMRHATRELVKGYVHGIDSRALDDVFELLAWNQGIGYFSSEIGPSTLFKAYKTIKILSIRVLKDHKFALNSKQNLVIKILMLR